MSLHVLLKPGRKDDKTRRKISPQCKTEGFEIYDIAEPLASFCQKILK
jgi:hypothetical protein